MLRESKKLISATLVAGSMLFAGLPAQAVDMDSVLSDIESADSNIGLYSQYVFRGQRSSLGAMSVQGDIGIEHESGISANAWFATLGAGNSTEFDFTVDYSADLGFMGYSAGIILYRYHNIGSLNATEVYAGANHELGSATFYYDIDSKNIWLDFSSGLELDEFVIDGTLSFSAPDVGTSEFVNLAVGISKEVEIDDVILTPSFTYNYHMGALDTAFSPDVIVFAVNMNY